MNLREELVKIRDAKGYLTPDVVMEAARPRSHPLHAKVFDKPIREAAEAYYRENAYRLIAVAFRVTESADEETPIRKIRAFRPVPADTPGGVDYTPIEEIAKDPVKVEIVRRDLERDWKSILDRAKEFDEFLAEMAADLEKALSE